MSFLSSLLVLLSLISLLSFSISSISSSPFSSHHSPHHYDVSSFSSHVDSTVLTDYLALPDPVYSYYEVKNSSWRGADYTVYVLNVTSLQWLTSADVDRPIWYHYVAIVVPDKLNPLFSHTALVYVTELSNSIKDFPNSKLFDSLPPIEIVCVPLGIVAVIQYQNPNQALRFTADPIHKDRKEDDLLAMAWYQYIKTNETRWIPRLPMVKSVIKVMDATQSWAPSRINLKIKNFIIAGASKRGWVTWLMGAIEEPRVVAIIPIVMSELNFVPTLIHHFRSLGGWSFALQPYYALNLTRDLLSPGLTTLMDVVDPLQYTDRLQYVKKMIVSGSGDMIFLLDDDHYWWNSIAANNTITYRRMMQNCEHSMGECIFALLDSMKGYIAGLLYNDPTPPQFTWKMDNTTGDITLKSTQGVITSCVMWVAHTISTTRRDFRLLIAGANGKPEIQPVWWKSYPLDPVKVENEDENSSNVITYIASQPMPANGTGWTGFFIEIQYASYQGFNYEFTSQVSIIPNYLPFPDCRPDNCYGTLV